MTFINPTALDLHGTIEEYDDDTHTTSTKWVYQTVHPGFGNVSNGGKFDRQRRLWRATPNPNTIAQLVSQHRMRIAVEDWQNLTDSERQEWRNRAVEKKMLGYSLFIRWRMTQPFIPAGTLWDAGTTEWDDGSTTWDLSPGVQWDDSSTIWDGGSTIWIS